ncbi:hypothetical protein [Labrenzia sp. PHM005]|uniref:hypothetical protein n=1 Tax=Labrenzia sp. PHM005 TaxID=2590016 RepID=UPI00114086CE|nr:hypothetical protein [Labrenzia sp. PHM005]QDG76272.1 hypothetical protein FJ695_10525 [Labrenzia sp. PHM005]
MSSQADCPPWANFGNLHETGAIAPVWPKRQELKNKNEALFSRSDYPLLNSRTSANSQMIT